MIGQIPNRTELETLLGENVYSVWNDLVTYISHCYITDILWRPAGKYGVWECKFQRSGKTLITLYLKEKTFDVLLIYGRTEREKFEAERPSFSTEILLVPDNTTVFHDGKWMFIPVSDGHLIRDIISMLSIKKKPDAMITMCGYRCDLCKAYAPNIKKKDER